jgi:hypothetical protein
LDAGPELAAVTFAWLDEPGAVPSAPAFERRGPAAGIQPVSPSLARAAVVRRLGGFYEKGSRYGEGGNRRARPEPLRLVSTLATTTLGTLAGRLDRPRKGIR